MERQSGRGHEDPRRGLIASNHRYNHVPLAMLTIDAHHHFWRFNEREYGWVDRSQTALRRDFLPPDLEKELRPAGIGAVVTVQARQSLEETHWLLELSRTHNIIAGVVGWVPLMSPELGDILTALRANKSKLRGVRHVLQGEPSEYMLTDEFNRGIAALTPAQLVYDVLIHERQLPAAITFVDRHPSQIFVLDHIAKPKIASAEWQPWAAQISELARRPNVYCKISGMVTEADATWSDTTLRPYFDHVLKAFGPRRLMFGSDWPVCLDRCSYLQWRELVGRWISQLSLSEQARILGETATEAYQLKVTAA